MTIYSKFMAAPTTCAHAMIWQGLCADCGADVSLLQRERRDELVPIIGGGISHHGLVAHRKASRGFSQCIKV